MVQLDSQVQPDEHSAYAGRWIATIGDQVIAQGGTPQQALHAAQSSRFKETPHISYIPPSPTLQIHPFLAEIAASFAPEQPVYVAGGAVRNALLNLPVNELDLILPDEAIKHARRIADRFKGAFYVLDQERDYGRALIPQPGGQTLVLDFATFQGDDLDADLRNRDFTINALAVGIQPPHPLFDPLGGAADLREKRLRACHADAIRDDPVRILRGVRFLNQFDLRPDKQTKTLMRAGVDLIPRVSVERLRDEIFHLLERRRPARAVKILDRLDALRYCLPELIQLQDLPQTQPHIFDAWRHTLEVVEELEKILDGLSPAVNFDKTANFQMGVISHQLGRYRDQLAAHLDQGIVPTRSLRGLIFLAALYHDVGKPDSKLNDPERGIRYLNHEAIGAELASQRARELHLSNEETRRLELIVRHHMRPLWLAQTGNLPSRRAKYRFFKDTGAAGVDICLLSLADTLATYSHTLPAEVWVHQVEVVRSMLEAWWEHKDEQISPQLLVNGKDLMAALQLKPGPLIGRMLAAIQEAQATGEVSNQRQALELAEKLAEQSAADS